MVREKVSSVVFQIFFCFCLIQGTAGDSSSQTDTNTIVGKPKLGKKGNKIYRSGAHFIGFAGYFISSAPCIFLSKHGKAPYQQPHPKNEL